MHLARGTVIVEVVADAAFKKDEELLGIVHESCLLELEALLDLERRYAAKARELASTASPQRASQLLRMANALDRVPDYIGGDFHVLLQLVIDLA